mgnify:CR=1 FL=1
MEISTIKNIVNSEFDPDGLLSILHDSKERAISVPDTNIIFGGVIIAFALLMLISDNTTANI